MSTKNTINLSKGSVFIYRFSNIILYSYLTNDPMNDVVTIIAKNRHGVVIDSPNFSDNIAELSEYIESLGITIDGVVLNYHMAGASFLPKARKYSTYRANAYARSGLGKHLVDEFVEAFGDAFDKELPKTTDIIAEGEIAIAGIKLLISETDEAFNIEIPEINTAYIHMLGHDVHSIVTSPEQASDMIRQLQTLIIKGYDLILSGHHAPETTSDMEFKIDYLQKLLKLAETSPSAEQFKSAMREAFPNCGGENYLEMTARALFEA